MCNQQTCVKCLLLFRVHFSDETAFNQLQPSPRSTVFEEHVSPEGPFHKSLSMADSAPSEIYGKEEHTMFLQMSLCFMT